MSETLEKHVKIYEKKSNNTNVIYPENTDVDVQITSTSNTNIPSTVETLHDVVDTLGRGAFGFEVQDISIPVSSWVDNEYTYTDGRIMSTHIIDVYYNTMSIDVMAECSPKYSQNNGSVTITVSSVPTETVTIDVLKVW